MFLEEIESLDKVWQSNEPASTMFTGRGFSGEGMSRRMPRRVACEGLPTDTHIQTHKGDSKVKNKTLKLVIFMRKELVLW